MSAWHAVSNFKRNNNFFFGTPLTEKTVLFNPPMIECHHESAHTHTHISWRKSLHSSMHILPINETNLCTCEHTKNLSYGAQTENMFCIIAGLERKKSYILRKWKPSSYVYIPHLILKQFSIRLDSVLLVRWWEWCNYLCYSDSFSFF